MNYTIKEVFDCKYFHGRLTHEEADNLCKEEMTNTGKPEASIWYLFESDGRLRGHSRRQSAPNDDGIVVVGQAWNHRFPTYAYDMDSAVTRKNPHTLLELARVATLDNCNGYCCLRSLREKIDEFEIPRSEKEELKKLARGFRLTLVEKIPNELSSKCIHN